jgi:hypothetical protein
MNTQLSLPGVSTIASAAAIATLLYWIVTSRRGSPLSMRGAGGFVALRLYERKLVLIGIGFATIAFLGALAIAGAGEALGSGETWPVAAAVAWLIAWPFALNRPRYPGALRLGHSLVIKASPEQVWAAVSYRPTHDYYRATVARIARRPGERETYDLHIRDLGRCRRCGLPKPPDRSIKTVTVEIVERVECRLERTRSVVAPGQGSPVVREEHNEWRIEPHPEGALVTRSSVAFGPTLSFWLTARVKMRNSARDNLIALKSHLEGAPGVGSFSAAREMLEASRAAPRHCRCE